MTINEAERIIREKKNVGSVRIRFETDSEFVFVVSPYGKFIPADTEAYCIAINKSTNKERSFKSDANIFNYMIDNKEKIEYVDATKEQLESL